MAVRSRHTRALVALCLATFLLTSCFVAYDRRTAREVDDIVFMGDSMMYGLMESLAAQFQYTPTKAHYLGAPGTGLLAAQGRFGPGPWWEVQLAEFLAETHPQVVVIEAIGVHPDLLWGDPYYTEDGTLVEPDTELFWSEWEAAGARLIDMAEAAGASVWWVIPPEFDVEWQWSARIHRANDIARAQGRPVIEMQSMIDGYDDPYAAMEVWSGLHFSDAYEPAAARRIVNAAIDFQSAV